MAVLSRNLGKNLSETTHNLLEIVEIWEVVMFSRLFLDHPRSVKESYFEHFWFAGKFAVRLFAAGGAAAIHALFPCLFEKTASRMIRRMHERLANR